MLIGILGRKRVGKDTATDYLCMKYGFEKVALAEPLKKACKVLFNFSDDQLYEQKDVIDSRYGIPPRVVLQYLGTDIFRNDINKLIPNIENNFWVNLTIDSYEKRTSMNDKIRMAVSDVRFQNEVDKIRENDGIIVKIVNPTAIIDEYETQTGIDNVTYDYVIVNDGTKYDLYAKIDDIMAILIK